MSARCQNLKESREHTIKTSPEEVLERVSLVCQEPIVRTSWDALHGVRNYGKLTRRCLTGGS